MCDLTSDLLVTFSDSLTAPSEARSHVRRHGCPEHGVFALGALLLVTSELVTNAVRHGQPPIVLRLSCLTSAIRLSVTDDGPDLPREQGTRGAPDPTGARLPREGSRGGLGLGLVIVAKTSREWGITPLATGKEVWSLVPTGMPPVSGPDTRAAGFDKSQTPAATEQAVHDPAPDLQWSTPGTEVGEAEWVFAAQPRAVPQAHRLIAHTLHHLPDKSQEVVLLLADELMTNAVLHPTGAVGLHLGWDREGVRVEVTDPSSGSPAVQSLDRDALDSRGIRLVNSLVIDGGRYPSETGKGQTAWFTLHA